MEILAVVLAASSLAAWLYLTFLNGGFWRADVRLEPAPEPATRSATWPAVAAVVPARDEAEVIVTSLGSLLDQDYSGPFLVVLVDDASSDGTAELARELAAGHPRGDRLRVVAAPTRPAGWVGKMWAVATGVDVARRELPAASHLLLTDADVAHGRESLRRLVAKAEADGLDLVSLMVLLSCRGGWDRLLIPAFVYFFQKLYPFRRVNDPRARTAAAAGGCMLVRAAALAAGGGIAAIRGEIIDDCALGRLLKRRGPIWLGLTENERSIRPYAGLAEVWNMVARTAFTQLRGSIALLLATVVGLALVYLVPPIAVVTAPLHGSGVAALLGALTWALMAFTFVPTLALYRRSPLWGFALPLAGLLYLGMTLDSAWRTWRGRGGAWKGRVQAGR